MLTLIIQKHLKQVKVLLSDGVIDFDFVFSGFRSCSFEVIDFGFCEGICLQDFGFLL